MSYFYEIVVKDHLGSSLKEWFEGMEFEQKLYGADREAVTVISGVIADQAALFGVLVKIYDLGLTLISINRIQRE